MNIIFHKSFGSRTLVAIFGKQSSQCNFCFRKVTQRNLGMIFKGGKESNDTPYVCCNSIICLLEAEEVRKS